MRWRARHFEFSFPRPVLVMGVVNVTPDSFSDGGRFLDPAAAVSHALELVAQGADILDIGGESTRPNAQPVSQADELSRVMPVIEGLVSQIAVPISIDTMKPAVARTALEAGAAIVNDVAASRFDPEMWSHVAAWGAGYVAMHMLGTPRSMQCDPVYEDVVTNVSEFFDDRLRRLEAAGVAREQVVLDPGFGFGKTVAHNLQLLAALARFRKWLRPLLLGVSRKSFIGHVTGEASPTERLPGSLACACWGTASGVNIVRTHDVRATRQALRMTEAILAAATAAGG